jgi:hypothetical protein
MLEETPWLFREREPAYGQWRSELGDELAKITGELFVVGSAALGFSLVPEKAGRPFRPAEDPEGPSDVDLALVSEQLFAACWDTLVTWERAKKLRVSFDQRMRVKTGIYWGHVSAVTVPKNTDPSRTLRMIAARVTRIPNTRGHPATFRVYRRREDLTGYQLHSIATLRKSVHS